MIIKKIIVIIIIVTYSLAFISADAVGNNGVVASSKQVASDVGIDILKRGGNAIDAAVAVAFALSVSHPSAGNLGGGGFMVINFSDGHSTTIDFREVAPIKSHKDMYLDSEGNVISGLSTLSALASGVPGSVFGLGYAHEKYGNLSWYDVLLPSVILAKFGFKLDAHNVSILNNPYLKSKLSVDSYTKSIFTKNSLFKINELFIQKDLAKTLNRIADYGYKEFYYGQTADMIVSFMNKNNGIISHEDLRTYSIVEAPPINFSYRNYNILSMPPSSSGGITLGIILNQLENFDFSNFSFHDASHVHLLAEVEKRAYADRHQYLGDMQFIDVPIDYLLSDTHANKLVDSIDFTKSSSSDLFGDPELILDLESEETTHFSIVDSYGNAVSVTTTLNGWFGNGLCVEGAGFLMNNEMDDFSIKPGHPNMYGLIGSKANEIQPKKRMLSSMTPTIVTNSDGSPFLVLGSPGGSTIITTVAQIINNVIDFNMEIKDAVERKRFHHQWIPNQIQIEKHSLSNEVINKLEDMGHDIIYRSNVGIGEANCIMIVNDTYYGVGDSRRGGRASAY